MTAPNFDTITLAGTRLTADLTDAVTSIQVEYGTGTVAQLTLAVTDSAKALAGSPLLAPGTAMTWQGDRWQVAGRSSTRGSDDTLTHTFTARSALARSLRRRYQASAEKRVSPSEWVTRRVAKAGGQAVCQASAKQGTIAQSSGKDRQSDLDVIANLGSDQEWTWVEWGGRLYFGHRHWAWSTNPTGRSWSVTWGVDPATDALGSDLAWDDDDTENAIAGTVDLPNAYGSLIRPWDRLVVAGFGPLATVLVEQVSITVDGTSPVQVQVAQPRPPAKKAGSSS
jgi:hypothetical protein